MILTKYRVAAAGGALAVALALLPGATAQAADEPDTGKTPPQVELVLDVSGSMRAKDIDGASRMSAAKQSFNEVLDAVPEDVELGIRTLGADYPGEDRETGCKDTRQLYPVGHPDRTEAKAAVATLSPTGWTPIGPALLGAADDLRGGEASKRIVLITDGEDTCHRDPCEVAREIAAKGVHLVVDTLGLVPDAKTRDQLSCIAEATGGTYTTVRHTKDLSGRVKQLVHRAADPVVTPSAVSGAAECAKAPELRTGLYSDRARIGEHRWYRVELPPGKELRAAVTVAADRAVAPDSGVLLRAVTLRGREIVRGEAAGTGRTDALSTGLRYPKPEADDDDGDQPPAETVCLQVAHSFTDQGASTAKTPGLPLELTIEVVGGPSNGSDVASFGLGHGWWLLGLLAVVGLLTGLVWGFVSRWRVTVWRSN